MKKEIYFRNAKPQEKPYKITDSGGLYMHIMPKGGKLWRLYYRFDGKQKTLALGKYPDVSLEQARQRRDEARKLIANDKDPVEIKKAQKAARKEATANSFEVIAWEWFNQQKDTWTASHANRTIERLRRNVFPFIGHKPISQLSSSEYLAVFRKIEERGIIETAHRIKNVCGQIHRYAIATGRAENDPIQALTGALKPARQKHLAAVTEPKQVAELLRMINGYTGSFIVASAMKIAPYVFVRPGELRQAKWADIDLEAAEWRYTIDKTKTNHIVPLAEQVIEILKELHPLTGHGERVFPSERGGGRAMSDNTINAAFRRMGIGKDEMTAHGFRAMARTILDEVLGERIDLIEHQLAHSVRDALGRAYNRTAHLPERKRMMQRWADYLDELKTGAKIIPFHTKAG